LQNLYEHLVILIFLYLAKKNSKKCKKSNFEDKDEKVNNDNINSNNMEKYDIQPEIDRFLEAQELNIS
jgi:uncharacterized protein YjaG (DUF416 family)